MTAPARSEPQLEFFEEEHEYRLDKVKIPSVTQVLSAGRDLSRIPRYTGIFGTLVHKACELDSLGDLDEDSLVAQDIDGKWCDPWPRLRAWRKRTRGARPEHVELPVWGEIDGLKFAGMIDVVWVNGAGGYAVIDDIKTGAPRKEHGAQVWAYAQAYTQRHEREVREQMCTYLAADETFKSVVYDQTDVHGDAFRAALHRFYEGM